MAVLCSWILLTVTCHAGAPIQNSCRVKYQHTPQESNASSLLVHAEEYKCRQTYLSHIQVNCLFCHTRRGLGPFQCFSHYFGIGRGKASNMLKDLPSNFTELWQYFRQFLINFYTDKIRFYLDKQITFLNKLPEIIIRYNYRSG